MDTWGDRPGNGLRQLCPESLCVVEQPLTHEHVLLVRVYEPRYACRQYHSSNWLMAASLSGRQLFQSLAYTPVLQ